MGIMHHAAILATTGLPKFATKLLDWIKSLPPDERIFFIVGPPLMNEFQTFVMVPDGSKEGWADSDRGDDMRNRFIARLKEDNYSETDSPWDWVEVEWGELQTDVTRTNCQNK